MKLSKLECHVLNGVADDYMSMDDVLRGRRNEFGSSVSGEEVKESLRKLVSVGLVHAYRYDIENRKYVRTSVDEEEKDVQFWYYIGDRGLAELDANWDDRWTKEE